MDSSRKRRGFIKSKLTPFYRSAKPSTTTTTSVQYSNKVQSSASQSSPSTASVGFIVQHHHHHQQQDYIITPPKPKVSFAVPADSNGTASRDKLSLSKLEKLYGVAGDESVDIKAASYISSVQERFKLERTHSERIMQQT